MVARSRSIFYRGLAGAFRTEEETTPAMMTAAVGEGRQGSSPPAPGEGRQGSSAGFDLAVLGQLLRAAGREEVSLATPIFSRMLCPHKNKQKLLMREFP